ENAERVLSAGSRTIRSVSPPNEHNMAICLHFERSGCHKDGCPYLHVKLSPDAAVCPAFALEGYCDSGSQCLLRHVFECPAFAASGGCEDDACRLPHKPKSKTHNGKATAAGRMGPYKGYGERKGKNSSWTAPTEEEELLMRLPIRPDFSIDEVPEQEGDDGSDSKEDEDEEEVPESAEEEEDDEEEEEEDDEKTGQEDVDGCAMEDVIEILSESEDEEQEDGSEDDEDVARQDRDIDDSIFQERTWDDYAGDDGVVDLTRD
ncbi:hypothetical protein HKX48_007578, partial [Thoreauomyces humboldtii]